MARIMVVEDEPVTATDLEHKLTSLGHEVVAWSDNAEDAVARAKALAPDLVLMDIRLRGAMSGIDAARQLHEQSDVPVVFLTAFADQDTVDRACETLPYGYLLKPFTERSIVAAVQVALARAREEHARAARERWVLAGLRSAGEALVAVDEHGAIRFINEHAEALLQVQSRDVLGKDARTVVRMTDDRPHDFTHPLDLALRESRVTSSSTQTRLLRATGAPVAISYSAAPVLAANQAKAGAVLIFREVPQHDAALAERGSSVRALSTRLSHEINNPLTYNLGALQLALRELDQLRALGSLGTTTHETPTADREERLLHIEQLLRDAQEGANRVAVIMRELSSLARAEDDVAPLPPAELLDLAVGLSGAASQQVHFERQVEPAPIVRGSKWQLAQVLAQGIQDAVGAMDARGPGPRELALEVGSDARGWAEIRVIAADRGFTGAPLPVPSPGDTVPRKTRVDVLIADQVVARYGGELTIDEQPAGRVLSLRLPPMSRTAPTRKVAGATEARPARGSVLVIDDEPLIGRVLTMSLQPEHDVTTVTSAESALALLERGDAFDAILCDLTMPGMSGQQFYETLSASRPDLAERVILMTGGATTGPAERFIEHMAGRCILKPFTTDQLLPLLAERVRARAAPHPLPQA